SFGILDEKKLGCTRSLVALRSSGAAILPETEFCAGNQLGDKPEEPVGHRRSAGNAQSGDQVELKSGGITVAAGGYIVEEVIVVGRSRVIDGRVQEGELGLAEADAGSIDVREKAGGHGRRN